MLRPFMIILADNSPNDDLYDRFDAVLAHRADGNQFRIYDSDDTDIVDPDLLIEAQAHMSSTMLLYRFRPRARLRISPECDAPRINYILDELVYRRYYYPRVVIADSGQTLTQGDIHTMTRVHRRLLLNTDYGHCTVSDPQQMRELLNSPIFYADSAHTCISHHDIDYPDLAKMLVLRSDPYAPHQTKYRRARRALPAAPCPPSCPALRPSLSASAAWRTCT